MFVVVECVRDFFSSERSSDHVFKCSHKLSFNSVMYIYV